MEFGEKLGFVEGKSAGRGLWSGHNEHLIPSLVVIESRILSIGALEEERKETKKWKIIIWHSTSFWGSLFIRTEHKDERKMHEECERVWVCASRIAQLTQSFLRPVISSGEWLNGKSNDTSILFRAKVNAQTSSSGMNDGSMDNEWNERDRLFLSFAFCAFTVWRAVHFFPRCYEQWSRRSCGAVYSHGEMLGSVGVETDDS